MVGEGGVIARLLAIQETSPIGVIVMSHIIYYIFKTPAVLLKDDLQKEGKKLIRKKKVCVCIFIYIYIFLV